MAKKRKTMTRRRSHNTVAEETLIEYPYQALEIVL